MGQVIPLHRAAPESAVERLNRLTGLDFSEYPESLLDVINQDADETLCGASQGQK